MQYAGEEGYLAQLCGRNSSYVCHFGYFYVISIEVFRVWEFLSARDHSQNMTLTVACLILI